MTGSSYEEFMSYIFALLKQFSDEEDRPRTLKNETLQLAQCTF